MEYVTNLMSATTDPVEWARRREDQGWDLLSVADHFLMPGRQLPHLWVTAAAMATVTDRVGITTAFTNNLFRSPVEVAQASLSMQLVSNGRFELGLGAGWAREELEDAGLPYPEPRDRAGALIESVQIIRSLLHTGASRFEGDYYAIDIEGVGAVSDSPPPLVASVGGHRTVREVTPHCDRVEIKAMSSATRDGSLDMSAVAQVGDDHLVDMIDRVRKVDPDIPIGMFVLCNAAEDDRTRMMEDLLGNGLYGRFYGAPSKVAEGLAWLGELGISRCQLSPIDDTSLDRLAPLLYR